MAAPAANVAEAVARAQAIAKRLGQKRPADGDENEANKKLNLGLGSTSDPIGTRVEKWTIPEKYVGLIIGKAGDTIQRLQRDAKCQMQVSSSANGLPDREVTLTGTDETITTIKGMVQELLDKAASSQTDPDLSVEEMYIPLNRVSQVIGKGGEIIRNLQVRNNVKMVVLQDVDGPLPETRPLRISGSKENCLKARTAVLDLLKDLDNEARHNSRTSGVMEKINVPKSCVGLVIGRHGDTIRQIAQESGAKVHFGDDDDGMAERKLTIQGPPEALEKAKQCVNQIISGDKPSGRGFGGAASKGGPGGFAQNRGDRNEDFVMVPMSKTGIIIGRGGETIRQLSAQSGAQIDLDKFADPNAKEKTFRLRGSIDQIARAKALIEDIVCEPDHPGYSRRRGNSEEGSGIGNDPATAAAVAVASLSMPWTWGTQQVDPQSGNWSAAWSDYYAQYGSYPQDMPAPVASTDAATRTISTAPVNSSRTQAGPQDAGSADYTDAWIAYYQGLGMHEQAEELKKQKSGIVESKTEKNVTNGNSNASGRS